VRIGIKFSLNLNCLGANEKVTNTHNAHQSMASEYKFAV